jgi:hypothetical protein
MPAQQRLWLHEEGAPAPPREEPARGSQEEPVCGLRLRSGDLTTQNVKLMAQHHDLKLLGLF